MVDLRFVGSLIYFYGVNKIMALLFNVTIVVMIFSLQYIEVIDLPK